MNNIFQRRRRLRSVTALTESFTRAKKFLSMPEHCWYVTADIIGNQKHLSYRQQTAGRKADLLHG
jgi:hypothetical protein